MVMFYLILCIFVYSWATVSVVVVLSRTRYTIITFCLLCIYVCTRNDRPTVAAIFVFDYYGYRVSTGEHSAVDTQPRFVRVDSKDECYKLYAVVMILIIFVSLAITFSEALTIINIIIYKYV